MGLMVKVRLLTFWPEGYNRGLTPAGWALGVVESVEGQEVSADFRLVAADSGSEFYLWI